MQSAVLPCAGLLEPKPQICAEWSGYELLPLWDHTVSAPPFNSDYGQKIRVHSNGPWIDVELVVVRRDSSPFGVWEKAKLPTN